MSIYQCCDKSEICNDQPTTADEPLTDEHCLRTAFLFDKVMHTSDKRQLHLKETFSMTRRVVSHLIPMYIQMQ